MKLFKELTDRQRSFLFPVTIAAVFVSIFIFVDIPLYNKSRNLEKKIGEEERRLDLIISMGQEYLLIKDEIDDIKERAFRGEGASLSGVDSIVFRSGLKKKLSSLRPTTSPITDGTNKIKFELSLEKVTLSDISHLLSAVESDGHSINIDRVSIKTTYDDPALFNTTVVVNALEKGQ